MYPEAFNDNKDDEEEDEDDIEAAIKKEVAQLKKGKKRKFINTSTNMDCGKLRRIWGGVVMGEGPFLIWGVGPVLFEAETLLSRFSDLLSLLTFSAIH